ncbi:MAG: Tm-1-like ATP-binding domain-containing protein [Caldilineales bacterium]|nr:Tm-1-like ATP-binding domain-containing protein [Caldilineales bacterium]MCW5861296.1 Tm-1-like ATP-binding domain-containing protein [Caldilineales bacterium]
MKTVHLIGTLDTKGAEIGYLRDRLEALGVATTVVDSGILGEPLGVELRPGRDISRAEAATFGGFTIDQLRHAGSRGKAVAGMRQALKTLVRQGWAEGKVAGVVSMGGAEGAVMGAAAMMQLPLGVPKVLVSPIASGKHYFDPMVGTSDIMVVHSVVDILGLNPIATTIFDNVAAALKGLVEHGHALPPPDPAGRYVAVTMLGNTTKAVMALKDRLAQAGYEAVIFHSNGVGGPAMEELAETGQFIGAIDFTTNEIYDPMTGGIHDGGPDRLKRVGLAGLPQVVVPGCIDFCVFHAGAIPPALHGRPVYDHNPEYTLVRASQAEMIELGHIFAGRLNLARGPVIIAVPTQGLSIPNHPGGVFWNPEADAAFLAAVRAEIRLDIPVLTFERHVNDPAFGVEVAEVFVGMMEKM